MEEEHDEKRGENLDEERRESLEDSKKDLEDDLLEKRKEKIVDFLKQKGNWISYLVLGFIVYIGVYIRMRNISRLTDITTGTWTLGPDLDPFLFLRWAEYIVENGSLMAVDMMRNVPLGFDTLGEMKLLAYMIVWFHKFLSALSLSDSVTYSAIIFPVVMFALTTIAFFLFARKIFYKEDKITKNLIALIATALFVLIPSLLPRTIAGIPEKESAAFFFMFLAFYFFLEAFTSEKLKRGLIFGILAGVSTGAMALIWGGVVFVFFTIPASILLAFLFGQIKKQEFYVYFSWLIVSFMIMVPFSTRYTLKNLIFSISSGSAFNILIIVGLSLLFMKVKIKKIEKIRERTKLPPELFYMIVSIIILFILVSVIFGPNFIFGQISHLKNSLIQPSESRFSFTVAENKQPYFHNDWEDSFGPEFKGIPVFFWLFFIGSIFLFNVLIAGLKRKEKWLLIFAYFIFLSAIIFSRYSPSSRLNGISSLSLFVYFGGWVFFLFSFMYIYYQKYQNREFSEFKKFNFCYIVYFIALTLGIIAARSAIRLIMVLGAVTPVVIAFLAVKTCQKSIKEKEELIRFFTGLIAIILIVSLLFTFNIYFKVDKATAQNFAPGAYQWQWQKAMAWVRENTPQDAVFAHWWDYGYWLQSIGKRATILDGGNAIVYWNHLLGRHVLTGSDEKKALEFLYTHNGTHLLIDSTEIGKYTAFSSIGADENYDRFSWISTFLVDDRQTHETNNETIYVYIGGTSTDEDIIWNENGKEIFFPGKKTGIGAIILKDIGGNFSQPEAVFIYNGDQYRIPLRYLYFESSDDFIDFGSGLEAGIFLFPKINYVNNEGININYFGAGLYLSKRTVHSQLARLYLFNRESDYFKLVHTESNMMIDSLRQQNVENGEFIFYQGFQGPIKIWEVNYPSDIQANPEFLERDFPNQSLNLAKPGEYS